jgi:hypothetical protein
VFDEYTREVDFMSKCAGMAAVMHRPTRATCTMHSPAYKHSQALDPGACLQPPDANLPSETWAASASSTYRQLV